MRLEGDGGVLGYCWGVWWMREKIVNPSGDRRYC